jgi:deazaflavin-dependent oxidoreductase (nitroreductase family)
MRRNKLRMMWAMHRRLIKASGGRFGGKVGKFLVLSLTTTGRRSGEPRTVLLPTIERPDGWVVVASNAGEDRDPPSWLNLVAQPLATIRVDRKNVEVRARELQDGERDEMNRRFEEIDKGYAVYPQRTTRRIVVVLLEPVRTNG